MIGPDAARPQPARRRARQRTRGDSTTTLAALLRATREVMEERGYQASRVADIAAAAGVAHGSFYNYFKNKDEALLAILEEPVTEMVAGSRGHGSTPRERIKKGTLGFLTSYHKHAKLMAVLIEAGASNPVFRERWLELRFRFLEPLLNVMQHERETGVLGWGNPVVLASLLGAMTEQTAYVWLVLRGDMSEAVQRRYGPEVATVSLDDLAEHVARIFCDGMYTAPAKPPGRQASGSG
jgi:AcrR family transcriptional regulator